MRECIITGRDIRRKEKTKIMHVLHEKNSIIAMQMVKNEIILQYVN